LDFGQKCTLGTKCSGTGQNVLAWNEIFLPAAYHLLDGERKITLHKNRNKISKQQKNIILDQFKKTKKLE
jgi:hypothetical protein